MPATALRNAPILHQDAHLTVAWVERFGATVNTWTGFLQGEEFRTRMDRCLELLRGASATAIVANVQDFRPLLQDDQDWSNDDWAPRAVAAGLQRMAVVLPRSVFSQIAVTRVVQRLDDSPIWLTQVAEVVDALRWLDVSARA